MVVRNARMDNAAPQPNCNHRGGLFDKKLNRNGKVTFFSAIRLPRVSVSTGSNLRTCRARARPRGGSALFAFAPLHRLATEGPIPETTPISQHIDLSRRPLSSG